MDKQRPVDLADLPEDFHAGGNNSGKPPYIFSFKKSLTCDHPLLEIMVRGTNMYRCTSCNYAYWIQNAIQWPLHWTVIMGAFQIQKFVKEFGLEAVQQVLARPIGQPDKHPQVPVLPDGKSFMDVLKEEDAKNVLEAVALFRLKETEKETNGWSPKRTLPWWRKVLHLRAQQSEPLPAPSAAEKGPESSG